MNKLRLFFIKNSKRSVLFFITALVVMLSQFGYAQVTITNRGVDVTVANPQTRIFVNGSYINEVGGQVSNGGELRISQNITNNAVNPLFLTPAGRVVLNGGGLQVIGGTTPINFNRLILSKGNEVRLGQNMNIIDSLYFIGGDIFLNGFNINLLNLGNIWGESNTKRIYGLTGLVRSTRIITFNFNNYVSGMGIYIGNNQGFGFGSIIERTHGKNTIVTDSSAFRYFNLKPANTADVDATFINYFDKEVPGLIKSNLRIFRSIDNGMNWARRDGSTNIATGVVETAQNINVLNNNQVIITVASQKCIDPPNPTSLPKTTEGSGFVVCNGKEFTLNATPKQAGRYRYEWKHSFRRFTDSTAAVVKIFTDSVVNSKYTVLITNLQSGCDSLATIWVNIVPQPFVNFDLGEVCSREKVKFTNFTTIQFGTIREYQWFVKDSLVSKTKDFAMSFPKAGWYNIRLEAVADYGNCQSKLTKRIPIYPKPKANFDFKGVCEGKALTFANTSIIEKPDSMDVSMTYAWDFGDGGISDQLTPVYTFKKAGTYKVRLIAKSNKNCVDTLIKEVVIFAIPKPLFTVKEACADAEISLTNNSSIAFGAISNFEWDFGDGTVSTEKNPIKKYAKAGTYTIKLTTKSASGCEDVLTQEVKIFAVPTIDLGKLQTTCAKTLTLDAKNVGSKYRWSDGSTDQRLTVLQNGTYSVEITSESGCTYKETVEVKLETLIKPDFLGKDRTVCEGDILDAGVWKSYRWQDGSTGRFFVVRQSGKFSVEVTDQSDCNGVSSVQINVLPSTKPNLGADKEICANETLTLDAGLSSVTYLWSTGATTKTISVSRIGTYWVKVKNAADCEIADTIIIRRKNTPIINLGIDRIVCENERVELNAGVPNGTYEWFSTKGFRASTQKVSVSIADTYWVRVTSPSGAFCTVGDTIALLGTTAITARYLAASTVNQGDTVSFINLTFPKPNSNTWNFADGNTSTKESPTHIFAKDGVFNVSLIVTNQNCRDTLTKTITVKKLGGGREESSPAVKPTALFEGITSVKVYPNPTEGFINLTLELAKAKAISLAIYDLSGRLLMTEEVEETKKYITKYNLTGVAQGMYILKIVAGGETISVKIMKY